MLVMNNQLFFIKNIAIFSTIAGEILFSIQSKWIDTAVENIACKLQIWRPYINELIAKLKDEDLSR
jgi:hypothetical protein